MATKIKKKTSVTKKRVKAPVALSKPAKPLAKKGQPELQLLWQEEIRSLQKQRFSSYKTAVGAVLANVCEKLQVPEARRPQTIERLSILFETSELLRQSLYKHLVIKK